MNTTIHRLKPFVRTPALATFAVLVVATHAWAHAFIDHADPAVGVVVKQAPAEVRLWYTQGLEAASSRVQVFDAAGKEVDKEDVHLDPKNDHLLIVSLPAGLGAGTYKVVWHAVSADTHHSEGSFEFRVEP